MAVTGKGTKDNPWLIDNLNDLKDYWKNKWHDDTISSDSDCYIVLTKDIDFNDFGGEWETVAMYSHGAGKTTYLDLDGHTIKNAVVKADNYLFSTVDGKRKGVIRNGKILNIFHNNSSGMFPYVGLENLSISTDLTSSKQVSFLYNNIHSCSMYIKSTKLLNTLFLNRLSAGTCVNDCDICLDILDVNQKDLFAAYDGMHICVSGSRIRGKIAGTLIVDNLQPRLITGGGAISKCVIDLAYHKSTSGNITLARGSSNLSVINKDKITGNFLPKIDGEGIIQCTDVEIKSAESLNAKGFTVIPVEISGD